MTTTYKIEATDILDNTPWNYSSEPETLVEGRGFKLFEAVYTTDETVLPAYWPVQLKTENAVFTSAFTRLLYGFSDFLAFMIEEQIYEDAEEIASEYVDCMQFIMEKPTPVTGCRFRVTYWLESNDSIRMEFNIAEVCEYMKAIDAEQIRKLKFCEDLLMFRSKSSCNMIMDQILNALDAEADDEEYSAQEKEEQDV